MLVLDYLSFILFCYVLSRSEDSKLNIVIEKCPLFFFLMKSMVFTKFKNFSLSLRIKIEMLLFLTCHCQIFKFSHSQNRN